jgi:hypothetical protein
VFTVELQKGSPLMESPLNGKFCQKVTCASEDANTGRFWLPLSTGTVFIDPERTYRVKARLYIPGANRVFFSSYAQDTEGNQLKTEEGKTWAWTLGVEGPTDGFQTFETTIGPDGSGAEHVFPTGALRLNPGVRVYDGSGTFYVDDLIFEATDFSRGSDRR